MKRGPQRFTAAARMTNSPLLSRARMLSLVAVPGPRTAPPDAIGIAGMLGSPAAAPPVTEEMALRMAAPTCLALLMIQSKTLWAIAGIAFQKSLQPLAISSNDNPRAL